MRSKLNREVIIAHEVICDTGPVPKMLLGTVVSAGTDRLTNVMEFCYDALQRDLASAVGKELG
jgi:hypothetical protein